MKSFTRNSVTVLLVLFVTSALFSQEYRAIDGYNTNLAHPDWGSAGVAELNYGTIGFTDGISEPAGEDRPNARVISNAIFPQTNLENDSRGLSAYVWGWGQFIDHDITLVKDNPQEPDDITVPPFDVFFDPAGTGTQVIPMKRSEYDPATGIDINNPRAVVNSITAFIDASTIYGSDVARATWLRTFAGGKLKTSAGNLLPFNTITGEYAAPVDPNAPEMAMLPGHTKWFVSGDFRANENPFLTAMHTLWTREHNRLCDQLAQEHPTWTDEQLYQHARKLVGGEYQAIVYEEWLPMLGMAVPAYSGYNYTINPGIMNVFSAAAYRYGHTTINSLLLRMDNQGNHVEQGDILLRDAFFNPDAILEVDGIESYLIGMSTVMQQENDCRVIDDLRNFLFGQPGAGGLDLVSINIQRGRERGLPDYNTVRADFGLPVIPDFNSMTGDPLMNLSLQQVYQDINNIDPWVGMLSEDHMTNALFGTTAMAVVKKQFMALRDGDRFYYENDPWLTPEEKQQIKSTRLSDVIRRNTDITVIGDEIFMATPITTATAEIEGQSKIDFGVYPNPTIEIVNVRIDAAGARDATIVIADMSGSVVMKEHQALQPGANVVPMHIPSSLPDGVYNITVVTDRGSGNERFVRVNG